MIKRPAHLLTVIVTVALVLGGCSSTSPSSRTAGTTPDPNNNPNAGRYSMENDSPLLERIDLSTIEAVTPQVETRTIAGNKSPYTINGRTYYVRADEAGYIANGYASWYGRKFHGHQTSNGEIYDMFKLSAAHKTLPIPSYAKVTNLDNGRSVIVRINDRGPFHDDRIIDLSYAAASMLDYAQKGTARVRVEAILPGTTQPAPVLAGNAAPTAPVSIAPVLTSSPLPADDVLPPSGGEYLQIGAYASEDSARSLIPRLAGITSLPVVIHSESQPGTGNLLHRVRLGPLDDSVNVDSLIRSIRDANLGNPFRVSQ